jgi:hypothetical protein
VEHHAVTVTAETLLIEMIAVFHERGVDRLPTDEIVEALAARGRKITANRLARTLKPHGVKPRQFRIQGERRWGYLLADLAGGQDAALPQKDHGAGLSVESGDAAPAAGIRDAGIRDGAGGRDAAGEWAVLLAMHAGRW